MSIEYRPLTGVGRFNAKLNGGTLRIKHRLAIVANIMKPVSATELAKFQQDFQNLVTTHWTGKYMFQRAGVNVKPSFVLDFLDTANEAQAHFVVNLSNSAGGSENVGRDASAKHVALGAAAPRTTSFMTGSTQQPNSASLIAADLPKAFPYYVDFYGTNMSAQTKTQVESLMKQVAKINPQPKLYVTAYGGNSSVNQRALMTLLQQCGLTRVDARSSNKIFIPTTWGKTSTSKMSGRSDYAKISLKEDLDTQSILGQSTLYSYPATIVHEYGHMLGLQDEYHCLSSQAAQQMVALNLIDATEQTKFENFHYNGANQPSATVAAGQDEFVKACARANVEVPTFGRQTMSIMAAGTEFWPAHFVWLREALCQLTAQQDWAIVPHA